MPRRASRDRRRLKRALSRLSRYHPKAVDLSLGRIERLLRKLGHPERRLPPVFHVAGTNGKGSVVAYLRAMCEAAGLKVHVYTSPHLVRFEERIRLAGKLIAPMALADVLGRCEQANRGRPITFFEITTAAALLAFAETKADVCLLEVGLGGRLDATNVVGHPAAAVIAPVGLDHAAFLGRTLRKVASEKAGIAKRGAPLVVGPQKREALAAIRRRAKKIGGRIFAAGRHWRFETKEERFVFSGFGRTLSLPRPSLQGDHQIGNAALAVAALLAQNRIVLAETHIRKGLQSAVWPARFQALPPARFKTALAKASRVWLDGGHNPLAGEALGRQLRDVVTKSRPLYVVAGMIEGKDAKGFLAPVLRRANGFYAVPIRGPEKCIAPATLVAIAKRLGVPARAVNSVDAAVRAIAQPNSGPADILITGSLYLSGEVLKSMRIYPD